MELDLRVRHALHRLVRELGVEAINDAPRVRAALADLLAMEARALDRQIQAVAEAADAGVVRAIQSNTAMDEQLASRLLDRGLDPSTAHAIVEGWRDALGIPSPGGPPSAPPPPAGARIPPMTEQSPPGSDETLSGPTDPGSDATLAGPDTPPSGPPVGAPVPPGGQVGESGGSGGSGGSGDTGLLGSFGGWPVVGVAAVIILVAALVGWALGRDPAAPQADPAGATASESAEPTEEPTEQPTEDDTETARPSEPADPPSSEAPPSSPEPTTAPDASDQWTAEEERLLLLVPSLDFRNACEPFRDGSDAPGEIGEIRCRHNGTTVYYQSYATVQELNQRFAAQQQEGLGTDGNDCADPDKFRAQDTYQASSDTDGDLRCYFDDDGTPRLTWTDWSQRVWAHAVRSDDDPARLWADWFDLGPTD